MPSRRNFLRTGAAIAGASLIESAAAAPAPPLAKRGDVPPSIAALKSLRERARPITNQERQARLEKARALMKANGIDAILMIGGASLLYYTSLRWWNSERLGALVLHVKGNAFFVAPAFEEGRLQEQLKAGPLAGNSQVLTWEEDDNPYALVGRGLSDRGISSGTLGIEETVKFVFADGIAKAAPALKLVSATPVTAGCRMVKDAHELELMRLASQVTLKAYEAAWRSLREGMTQRNVEELISEAHRRLGFSGGASVQVGPYSALPHGSLTPQVIREGTILMIDGGGDVEGYKSDITRTFVLGKARDGKLRDKMLRVFEIVQRAQQAALKAAQPGAPCEAVDAAARKLISDAGFAPGYKYFTHRLGHGIGMDGHEWPYLVRGNTLPLAPGMTFSDEPGIYIRGEFGVRLEDDMVISANGAELLTPPSPSLEQPFGR